MVYPNPTKIKLKQLYTQLAQLLGKKSEDK